MKKAIIIPVYIRLNKTEELLSSRELELTKRVLKSLKILKDQDFVIILPVCLDINDGNKDSIQKLDIRLKEELSSLISKKGLLFSSLKIGQLKEWIVNKNLKDFSNLIDLKGFSKIRNTGLLLAQALKISMVVFIDNDEVIEDPEYLRIASEYINQRWNGKLVSGKGGFYLNPDGSILLPLRGLWWDILWDKTRWMNKTYERILKSKDRLVCSPMLLGGNLVLHYRIFQKVPFDPFIPRGEDTDYLLNASQFGFCILFDKELRVKHLHPERTETFYHQELKGDIERFVYERSKLKKMGFSLNLDPYPGNFLKWSLYHKAILTTFFLSLDYLWKRRFAKAREVLSNLPFIFQKRSEDWSNYLRFKKEWQMVMKIISEGGIEELLRDCWI